MNFNIKPEWREPIRFGIIVFGVLAFCLWVPSLIIWLGWADWKLGWNEEAGVYLFAGAGAILTWLWNQTKPDTSEISKRLTDDQQARADLIANQQYAHIDGVLKKRLFEQVRISLGLTDMPDMLRRSLTSRFEQQRQLLPEDTEILELYRRSGRKLLILGQPGAGKTTLLLELLRDLLAQARRDEKAQIPVYLNLSNWAASEPEIGAWVRERMVAEYTIAKKVSQQWIAQARLVLLLDGLDEVDYTRRANCVDAINAFVAAHSLPLVVCSRTNDYEMLNSKLNLAQAVEIAPLTNAQIELYLTEPRLRLQGVHQMVSDDTELAELAQTPLMLSFMAMAYRGMSAAQLQRMIAGQTDRKQQLLNRFIVTQMQDTERASPTVQNNTIVTQLGWLRFLAQQLEQRKLQQYFIDEMQPDWLGKRRVSSYWLFDGLLYGLFGGLFSGLLFGLDFGLGFGLGFGLIVWLVAWLAISLVLWLLVWLVGGPDDNTIKRVEITSWQRPAPFDVIKVLSLAVLQGGAFVFGGYLSRLYGNGWGGGGIFLVTLLAWLIYGWSNDELVNGLIVGLVGGLLIGLLVELLPYGWRNNELVNGLFSGLLIGLLIGLEEVLQTQPSSGRNIPNQGVHMAGRMALRIGLVYGLFVGLVVGLLVGLVGGLAGGLVIGLARGLVSGLVGGLIVGLVGYGGREFIQHYLLRWMLARQGLFPRIQDLIPFLDAMARRVLLVHAGAHYRFVHRTLQEHFADLSDTEIDLLVAEIEDA